MRFHVLAADHDGALAHHGWMDAAVWAALRRLRDSGREAILVVEKRYTLPADHPTGLID